MKRTITLIIISGILLFLSSCIFFQNVNQPAVSAPNEIVSVTIVATTQGGSYEPYFGVCLPIGWSVPGDSVRCGGAYEEVIYYDTLISSLQESVSPAPNGYYWWAGKGTPDETAVGNVFANLKIQTDSQLGVFSIDYMLGDGYYGVNFERSNGHIMEITTEPMILYINPEEGYQNFSLDMNILGLNSHFSDGTGTENVWLSKGGNEINANSFIVNNNTSIDANFSVPLTAETGLWDVNVETDADGIVTKAEGFNVLPSPPIIVVSPDSLVVGVLPGSTRTKTITIGNEGEGDLYFTITGGFSESNCALKFNGLSTYVQCESSQSLNIQQSITVEAWIYPFGLDGNSRIFQKGASDNQYIFCANQSGSLNLNLTLDGIGHDFYSYIWPPNNEWHHCAALYNYESQKIQFFIDGENVKEYINVSGLISTTQEPLLIGTKYPGAVSGDYFNGIIDEIRIWNVARDQSEIQDYMYRALTGTELGLAAYWQFNEGNGNVTFDKTINANDGTLYGDVQWTNIAAPILPSWFQIITDSGFCWPHSSMDVEFLFDATEIDTGDYYASVIVKSNDPFTPSVVIPIHMIVSSTVGIEDGLNTPLAFNLEQNYPNPFNPSTTIKYSIPQASKVKLTLFNLLGEEVTTLVSEEKSAGNYSVELNAATLTSGVYFYQLKAGEYISVKKMLLLK